VIAGVFALGIFLGRGTWLFYTGQNERTVQRSSPGEDFAFIRPYASTKTSPDLRKIRELKTVPLTRWTR